MHARTRITALTTVVIAAAVAAPVAVANPAGGGAADSPAQAQPIARNTQVAGAFQGSSDYFDYYSFTVQAGETLRFTLTNTTSCTHSADVDQDGCPVYGWLADASNNQLGGPDSDAGGSTSVGPNGAYSSQVSWVWTFSQAGTYYIGLQDDEDPAIPAGTPSYTIEVTSTQSACQRLNAENDLAPAKNVKLVRRKNADGGTDLKGCVLPAGKVRTVARSVHEGTIDKSYAVRQVVGHQVLIHRSTSSQSGGGDATYVFNIATGKSYNVARTCYPTSGSCAPGTKAKAAFINGAGQAAAIVSPKQNPGVVRVLGFSSTGEKRVLDTGTPQAIPASSLSLHRHVVSWTHSGHVKTATLSG
jgi:uncharacterized cupredoxin-like copper-binding protein